MEARYVDARAREAGLRAQRDEAQCGFNVYPAADRRERLELLNERLEEAREELAAAEGALLWHQTQADSAA